MRAPRSPVSALAAAVVGLSLVPPHRSAAEVNRNWDTIWTYFNYPKGTPPLVELNLRTWARHNPGMKIRLVNESNVRDFVPDMPEEFFRQPYDQCKSDIIRAAVLYHHGGLYMDTDFLVVGSLEWILDKLEDHEIVSYGDHGKTEQTECGSQYSSNWHAGAKHNKFSEIWWENTKHRLTRACKPGNFENSVEQVCCHEEGAPEKDSKPCHIPWAQLEHLKTPNAWAANHKDDDPPPRLHPTGEDRLKLYCLHGKHSLTPHLHGEIFWQPWDAKHSRTGTTHWEIPNKRFNCSEASGGDLVCTYPQKKVYENFFGRPAYHLFFSTFASNKVKTVSDMLHRPWLLSEIYRRSLGLLRKRNADKGAEEV